MSEAVRSDTPVAAALGLRAWSIDFAAERVTWPDGLGRPGPAGRDLDLSLAAFGERFAEAERARVFAFVEDRVRHAGQDAVIDVTARGEGGQRLPLRLAGRICRTDHGLRLDGAVQSLAEVAEARWLAKGVSGILEAVFIADPSGVLVFDEHMRIRRANPAAHALFGVDPEGAPRSERMAAIKAALPPAVLDRFAACITSASAASGLVDLPGRARPCPWRANPYGGTAHDMHGVAVVLTPPAARAEAAPARPRDALALPVLEALQDPVVVVAVATGLIAYANRAARDLLHLEEGPTWRVGNFAEITRHFSGHRPAPVPGALAVNLPSGARIGRLPDDDEYLLVEYVYRR